MNDLKRWLNLLKNKFKYKVINWKNLLNKKLSNKVIDWETSTRLRFREMPPEKIEEFFSKGYKKRYFFPHRVYYLPKCGSDAHKLASRMCGEKNPNKLWEIILYATSPVIDEFPEELFFDDDLVCHQQQLGKKGQIATVNLIIKGKILYTTAHVSDIFQRISRRRKYKTRIEKKFKGWNYMLLNSIMIFAIENDIKTICIPNADLAYKNTDPQRQTQIGRELFKRIYDRTIHKIFEVHQKTDWWIVDVYKNQDKIVFPVINQEKFVREKIICLCHDIERGLGHVEVDSELAEYANKSSLQHLEEMLLIEKEAGIQATYSIVGCFLPEIRDKIEKGGHCVAFHSYNHNVNTPQLAKCRMIDYRIKGYRPPQSKITWDLRDRNLCNHNFEWLASSAHSLQIERPILENRIVKIPILFDDFSMYKSNQKYEDWERRAIKLIETNEFIAFSLHDCYAHYWLPYYRQFLKKIKKMGQLRTLNQVANELILCSSK